MPINIFVLLATVGISFSIAIIILLIATLFDKYSYEINEFFINTRDYFLYYYYTRQRTRRIKRLDNKYYGIGDKVNVVLSLRADESKWHKSNFLRPTPKNEIGYEAKRLLIDKKIICTVTDTTDVILSNKVKLIGYEISFKDRYGDLITLVVVADELRKVEIKDWKKVIEG